MKTHRVNKKSDSVVTKTFIPSSSSSQVIPSSSLLPINIIRAKNNSSNRGNSSNYASEQRSKAREIVNGLLRKNIKLLAIDFDKTFLSIHTMGYYQGQVEKLLEYIRSTFYYLIQELLNTPTYSQILHVCIVSFSSQHTLIKKLLKLAFKTSKTDRILIRCNTNEFMSCMATDGQDTSSFLGKEYHITSIITEIATKRNKTIQPHEVLLLDDDVTNILIAEEFGHKALEIRDEINLDLLNEFVNNYL
ncbi:unnamed protein product [Didymodactylos carnosus]|uniref:Uncharacterized protein n=1 Tax=Didymodactylos carnosus TaxID=1234261 RepID=A0A813R1V0_9BILA|nr:unnamed protein product [Didymodactylos carnosus]CAF0816637.1 unnamed protein product [Didymodactylos carnosus]CAF3559884.1 unnamed protein product [Didymodactylos carnosus]CAF3600742.1 unnamed protein product [Didymodactylos carnosus]